eukprot:CAMPEP_0179217514 /NCGR_PEP_ID=MMETSP0797-20121207/3961_1 /TAXON_ID=47934 /ORGANISM="Dinophysis acuminata, Strain DAEP01" /LENGTH=110 /DNA_ID=CAMNT_0020923761 /DNA_START=91 /DNA_END=419 /DNA_ORIENTATION=-
MNGPKLILRRCELRASSLNAAHRCPNLCRCRTCLARKPSRADTSGGAQQARVAAVMCVAPPRSAPHARAETHQLGGGSYLVAFGSSVSDLRLAEALSRSSRGIGAQGDFG